MPQCRDRRSIRAQLEADYPHVARDLLRQLLETMHVLYGLFGGDFEAFYILAVIAQRTVEHQDFRAAPLGEWLGEAARPMPSLTTNIRSVAQGTGIAEETVRRKVLALVAKGWVAREGNRLSYTAKGVQDLGAVRETLLDLAVQNYRMVEAKLAEDPVAPPKMGA